MGTRQAWRAWVRVELIGLLLGTGAPAVGQAEGPMPLALGDPAADLVFSPVVVPCRVVDTRPADPIAGGAQRSFVVAGVTGFEAQGGTAGGCGIPDGAAAVVVNFVAVGPAGPGNLRAWPFGGPTPNASIINYANLPGLNIANGVAVPLCPAPGPCPFDLTVQADVSATHLVADVLGFYQPVAAGGIGTGLLAPSAVTGPKLADGAVSGPKLAPGSVDSSRIVDGSIGAVDVDLAQLQARVTGACPPDSAIRVVDAAGAVTCQATGSTGTDHDHDTTYWKLTGNAGTAAGTHFLGTTDNVALELRANNTGALRLEPATSGFFGASPNLIGGFSGNTVTPGVIGATIAGGGAAASICPGPCLNQVTGEFGTVGGGHSNTASFGATVSGGRRNSANDTGTVGGGILNFASGNSATVGGGG
jgi:hypothetical protein